MTIYYSSSSALIDKHVHALHVLVHFLESVLVDEHHFDSCQLRNGTSCR